VASTPDLSALQNRVIEIASRAGVELWARRSISQQWYSELLADAALI
jgi:hypothetical protein